MLLKFIGNTLSLIPFLDANRRSRSVCTVSTPRRAFHAPHIVTLKFLYRRRRQRALPATEFLCVASDDPTSLAFPLGQSLQYLAPLSLPLAAFLYDTFRKFVEVERVGKKLSTFKLPPSEKVVAKEVKRAELSELVEKLNEPKAWLLLGPAGCGKSFLTQQAVRAIREADPGRPVLFLDPRKLCSAIYLNEVLGLLPRIEDIPIWIFSLLDNKERAAKLSDVDVRERFEVFFRFATEEMEAKKRPPIIFIDDIHSVLNSQAESSDISKAALKTVIEAIGRKAEVRQCTGIIVSSEYSALSKIKGIAGKSDGMPGMRPRYTEIYMHDPAPAVADPFLSQLFPNSAQVETIVSSIGTRFSLLVSISAFKSPDEVAKYLSIAVREERSKLKVYFNSRKTPEEVKEALQLRNFFDNLCSVTKDSERAQINWEAQTKVAVSEAGGILWESPLLLELNIIARDTLSDKKNFLIRPFLPATLEAYRTLKNSKEI